MKIGAYNVMFRLFVNYLVFQRKVLFFCYIVFGGSV